MNLSSALSSNGTNEDDHNAAASFVHSLSVVPLVTTGNGFSLALNGSNTMSDRHHETDILMMSPTATADSSPTNTPAYNLQQPESRMAVAELLVSLGQSSNGAEQHLQNGRQSAPTGSEAGVPQQTLSYRAAADYIGSVKKAYENSPKIYTDFLSALEQYNEMRLTIEQLPMTYSDYNARSIKTLATIPTGLPPAAATEQSNGQQAANDTTSSNGHAAADFLSLIKERSQREPDMYQHLITLLRKFQKDHSYSSLYFYVSIILRYHPHLLQRFHRFLPSVTSGVEVTEPKIISKAPPEELVISSDFIEAKDFVQTVKYEAQNDISMYDRFISALEKYQRTGWTIDQVYSEVSLIFWNHPDALAGFKKFITTVPQQS
ncbi:hypothetical protein FBU30_005636 [Linnemannia zychae]|nr:hypothetical protein FBU30_005636 [Linnemannia zychae]